MPNRERQWSKALDIPLTVSTLIFLAAYAWPILDPDLSRGWRQACTTAVWATWGLLGIDFGMRLYLAEDRRDFVRRHPLDLAVLILPLLRPLRLLRLITLLTALNRYAGSSLRGKIGVYLTGSVSLIIFVGALAVLDAERGHGGPIQSFGDALWWACTTVTTVGYGDMYPVTATGRLVAVFLMLGGIATVGVVTASFATWLLDQIREEKT
ncbi:two pore domain potassium channel family protein [Aeromicrobium phragmitis]|uniref:Two pore domain potassium channel family protein n=1 Tax=Aeromicrobium phragmitis TaxID=2478914 RepID=A0A3L8PJN0_9ACTN|nr:potassium channel family protein [Aeromicrobium phragmitis]RLV54979.1 two pore domain potassium channel family protein [Aeromicrobium phragmitis]